MAVSLKKRKNDKDTKSQCPEKMKSKTNMGNYECEFEARKDKRINDSFHKSIDEKVLTIYHV